MTGLEFFNAIGTIASIVGAINALKDSNNSTAAELFKKSCVEAVRQSAPDFADHTTPAEVDMDSDRLVTSLKDIDIPTLTSLEENAALAKITAIFQECIILPGSQLAEKDLERRLQPVIKKTFAIFFENLPRNQQTTNQMTLGYQQTQLANQEHLIKDTETIKENTRQIGEINKTAQAVHDTLHRHLDVNTSAALEKEYQSAIDNAKGLLKNNVSLKKVYSLQKHGDLAISLKFRELHRGFVV